MSILYLLDGQGPGLPLRSVLVVQLLHASAELGCGCGRDDVISKWMGFRVGWMGVGAWMEYHCRLVLDLTVHLRDLLLGRVVLLLNRQGLADHEQERLANRDGQEEAAVEDEDRGLDLSGQAFQEACSSTS